MSLSARRAWIEIVFARNLSFYKWSLSARRAWIEIKIPRAITDTGLVALRKESVDRNPKQDGNWGWGEESLSARRAWIEIGDQ